MGYDLTPDQAAELRERRLLQLRTDRYEALLNIERWSAIPESLVDGSERGGIEAARQVVNICEAQIDALEG